MWAVGITLGLSPSVQAATQAQTTPSPSLSAVRKRLLEFRQQLVGDTKNQAARQGLADLAVRIAREIGMLDIQGDAETAQL